MNKIVFLILSIVTIAHIHANPVKEKTNRILIYTKNGKGYIHENIPSSIKALQEICKQENIETDASEDPAVFTDENLKKYDAIIFSNTNNDVFDTKEQKNAFQKFIRNGGGFIGIHSANAVERKWPWFWALVGGKFIRHAPHQQFDVVVTDKKHPSTEFLGDRWTVKDECYYSNNLNPDIHILLSADLNTIKDKEMSEYPGDIFGDYFPLCWCHEFEGARQWFTALGHDAEMYNDPTFRKHLRGGILWVLKLKN
ncbi:MAG: ThuA domain-containing protein [Bacteroidetes bacterium]|nr:MAG: ThuA domain-containing protein [Bacteroidota bacterium]